jgi:RimJ/RimL family protein N-acetyltransferase
MVAIETGRLRLHAVDLAEAVRIHSGQPSDADAWCDGYPFEGDLAALGRFISASDSVEQRPFGYYQIARRSDGLAIGGIGFFGPPVDGVVEIGYGLVAAARGNGFAAEAVDAVRVIAANNGVSRIVARTDLDNYASQHTLLAAGFELVREDAELRYYERDV